MIISYEMCSKGIRHQSPVIHCLGHPAAVLKGAAAGYRDSNTAAANASRDIGARYGVMASPLT